MAIVLGAATSGSEVSEVYKQRLNHAMELYQNDYVKYIIVTGGKGKGNHFSDAAIAREYLVSMGLPDEVILEEGTSTITQENLENAKIIMEENGYETAAIVSDPLHMKRAMLLAKDSGIVAISSPTKSSAYKTLKTKIPFVAREAFFYIGYKWYRIWI
ncbi:MAG: YdcF family protein [Lachnospiraceae bacterium]